MSEPTPARPAPGEITAEIPVVVPDRVPSGVLEPVLARRESLRRGIDALERALATPASAPEWAEGVQRALARLRRAFEAHVDAAEGPTGLVAMMVEAAPRLIGPAQRLTAEHLDLHTRLAALEQGAQAHPVDVEALRTDGVTLIARLVRHRQRGSDLFYEAFEADVDGGE
jgi:hypothetical protein